METVFAESENFLAIYNLAPILAGHSLIIPRKHVLSLLDLSDAEYHELMIFAKEVTNILLKAFNSDSFNWSIQDNHAAGQTVLHLHLHIVPRLVGDMSDPGDWYPEISNNYKEILDSNNRYRLSREEMGIIVSKLKAVAKSRG
jgi:bis(5'-adenosyl)-triphosphatase